MKPKQKLYTEEEVVELLAAYAVSDDGVLSIEETKLLKPNDWLSTDYRAKTWLNSMAYKSVEEKAKSWYGHFAKYYQKTLQKIHITKDVTVIYKQDQLGIY